MTTRHGHDAAALELLNYSADLAFVKLSPTENISVLSKKPGIKTELIRDKQGAYIIRNDKNNENSIISGYCSDYVSKILTKILMENGYNQ